LYLLIWLTLPIRGICISEKVYQDISSIPEIKSEYIGYKRLKGLEHEMELRCISSLSMQLCIHLHHFSERLSLLLHCLLQIDSALWTFFSSCFA